MRSLWFPKHPQRLSKPLRADHEGYRSTRRSDYRILPRIDENKQSVLVVRSTTGRTPTDPSVVCQLLVDKTAVIGQPEKGLS